MADRVTLDSPSLSGGVRKSVPRRSGFSRARAGQDVIRRGRPPRTRLSDMQKLADVQQPQSQSVYKREESSQKPITDVTQVGAAELNLTKPVPVAVAEGPQTSMQMPVAETDPQSNAYKFPDIFNSNKIADVFAHLKDKGLYYLAGFLFLIGMTVSINALRISLQTEAQVESISTELNYSIGAPVADEDQEVSDEQNREPLSAYQVAPDEARFLRIPRLNVETRVGQVGLTSEGAVDVPDSFYDVARFNESAKPTADDGAMFIVGHNVAYRGTAVFFNLNKLEKGDLIELERGDGTNLVFRVVSNDTYQVGSVDMVAALRPVNKDKFGLNLMTCGGEFNEEDDTYDERVLIRTELVTTST